MCYEFFINADNEKFYTNSRESNKIDSRNYGFVLLILSLPKSALCARMDLLHLCVSQNHTYKSTKSRTNHCHTNHTHLDCLNSRICCTILSFFAPFFSSKSLCWCSSTTCAFPFVGTNSTHCYLLILLKFYCL